MVYNFYTTDINHLNSPHYNNYSQNEFPYLKIGIIKMINYQILYPKAVSCRF